MSKKKVKSLLDQSGCLVNGRVERMGKRPLFASDLVEVKSLERAPTLIFDPSRIFYEEEAFLLYDKPVGVTVEELLEKISLKGWSLIHRLDKETSGLLLIAKNQGTKERFIALFEKKAVRKKYLAWVEGHDLAPSGHLVTYIGKGQPLGGRPRFQVTENPSDQVAETEWEIVRKEGKKLLVALYPLTGRTHQLRVHLLHLGHPILGDSLYHPKGSVEAKRLLLHAEGLIFPHPFTQKEMKFSLPPPQDFY